MTPGARRHRILVLSPFPPCPGGTHGSARATGQFVTELAARHSVALVYLRGAGEAPVERGLRALCAWCEEVVRPTPGSSRLMQGWRYLRLLFAPLRGTPTWVADWSVREYAVRVREIVRAWRPDIVQIENCVMGQYRAVAAADGAACVLTAHEAGARAARDSSRSARGLRRAALRLDALAWQRYERRLLPSLDAVVALTGPDCEALRPAAGRAPVLRVRLGVPIPSCPLNPAGGPARSVLFVGNFVHPPNVDAAFRLVDHIFPRLRQLIPDAVLEIAGANAPAALARRKAQGVSLAGYVPDVNALMDNAMVVVAPLRFGGGMRVKVLEALGAGKAVVASPRACEGLDVVSGRELLVAETDDEFCTAVARLIRYPTERVALARRARAWACANLGWEAPLAIYESLYDKVAPR